MIVAKVLSFDRFTFLIASCICKAASLPTSPLICQNNCPETASAPKNTPLRVIIMISYGGKEKIV